MAARAAATSVPTSIVPVFSIVRETITGTSRFIRSSIPKQETSAILICSRSWHVSRIEEVDPGFDERARLLRERGPHRLEGDVSQRRELRGGPEGARHVRGFAVPTDRLAGVSDRRPVDLGDPVGQSVLRENDRVGAEGVRLEHRRPRGEEGGMPLPDHLGCGNVEEFVASVPPLPSGHGDLHPLQVRPARPVEKQEVPVPDRHRSPLGKCSILDQKTATVKRVFFPLDFEDPFLLSRYHPCIPYTIHIV